MKANPGGLLAPDQVVGRDDLIKDLWRILDRQSVVLTAERRMGKTSIIRKMQAELPSKKIAYFRDLERVHRPVEFAEIVFCDVEHALTTLQRGAARARRFLSRLSGAELSGFKFPDVADAHWKVLLTETVADLADAQMVDLAVVFFWDELPWALQNIAATSGERTAMEILDTLRSLRQMHPNLRMVFTGSVGLHHVISELRAKGYGNTPVNDMYPFDVPPLSLDGAMDLATRLLKGEAIKSDNLPQTARLVADSCNNVPFYIQHVVDQLKIRGVPGTSRNIHAIIDGALSDPQDIWDLRHFRQRVDTYYGKNASGVLNLLDIIAAGESALSIGEITNRANSSEELIEEELIRTLLELLECDHYLVRTTNGMLHFRLPLIKQWWRLNRGLLL